MNRYQATVAIRYIHRRRALAIWDRVREYNDVPLEIALLALDLFVISSATPDVEYVVQILDDLAAEFLAATPEFTKLEKTEEKSVKLITWMWSKGFKGCPAEHYRALKNVFIGLTLRTVRSAIPLTLVAIFCALARRVGLTAYPCGYPAHVLAIVESPEDEEYQYYDLFTGPGSHPRMEKARLVENFMPGENIAVFLAPATVSSMVIRAAQNIIATLQLRPAERPGDNISGYPEVDEHSTLYAALTAMVILRPKSGPIPPSIVEHMIQQIPSDFRMDVRFLEEELLPRVANKNFRDMTENVCGALRAEDTTPRNVARRNSPENQGVMVTMHLDRPEGKVLTL